MIGLRRLNRAAVAAGALAALLLGPASQASTPKPKPKAPSVPGPSYLQTGFTDYAAFTVPSAATRGLWLSRAQELGARWIRVTVAWEAVVNPHPTASFNASNPGDPNYEFLGLDSLDQEAAAHHLNLVFTILDPPAFALITDGGPNHFNGRPNITDLGEFARALATRYSGHYPDPGNPAQVLPRVSYFQAWNEPNLPATLAPQWTRNSKGQYIPFSPGYYRQMLNAVFANVKAAQPTAFVLAAGLAPYGDTPGSKPYLRMHPVTFLENMLCLTGTTRLRRQKCPNPAQFNAIDTHPYALTPVGHAYNELDVSVEDVGRLTRILHAAARFRTYLPKGPKPVWVTEVSWTSNPPVPSGIPLMLQAQYLERAFYEFWSQGVTHVFWLPLVDYPYENLTGSGVYFKNGTAKPSAGAFRFPFVAFPSGQRKVTVWGRAPRTGSVEIEALHGRQWRPLMKLKTTTGGIFYTRSQIAPRLSIRAVIGTSISNAWTT